MQQFDLVLLSSGGKDVSQDETNGYQHTQCEDASSVNIDAVWRMPLKKLDFPVPFFPTEKIDVSITQRRYLNYGRVYTTTRGTKRWRLTYDVVSGAEGFDHSLILIGCKPLYYHLLDIHARLTGVAKSSLL